MYVTSACWCSFIALFGHNLFDVFNARSPRPSADLNPSAVEAGSQSSAMAAKSKNRDASAVKEEANDVKGTNPILLPHIHANGTFTCTFARTWQWYIDSNSDAVGFDHSTNRIDEGWHYTPYKYLKASITPSQWQAAVINATAFKVDAMGLRLVIQL